MQHYFYVACCITGTQYLYILGILERIFPSEHVFKGPVTCKCLMTSLLLMCMSLYITKSLPARFKCVSYNYNYNFSCIFLRSGKPRLLKIHQIIVCLL